MHINLYIYIYASVYTYVRIHTLIYMYSTSPQGWRMPPVTAMAESFVRGTSPGASASIWGRMQLAITRKLGSFKGSYAAALKEFHEFGGFCKLGVHFLGGIIKRSLLQDPYYFGVHMALSITWGSFKEPYTLVVLFWLVYIHEVGLGLVPGVGIDGCVFKQGSFKGIYKTPLKGIGVDLRQA